jgi:ribosome modulation factor
MNAPQDFRAMTADTIGKDLLSALVQEIKLMPDVWPKLNQQRQDEVIERLRKRVEHNIRMAVHILASEGRTVIVGELDQVVRKDGIKAVFKINSAAAGRYELFDSEGKACLIVVADAGENLEGIDEIHGEPDQRAMDLGHEYHDNDGGGMDEAPDDNVVDAEYFEEVPQLPAPGDATPTEEELDKAFDDGYDAAEQGQPESACPVMAGALCIEWVKGWKAFHEEPGAEDGQGDAQADTAAAGGRVVAARYRHPSDTSLTWTGRGRKPAWVQNWLDNGGSLDDLDVNRDDQQAA